MAYALLYPEGHQGKKNLPNSVGEVNHEFLRMARKVSRWTPQAVAEVQMGEVWDSIEAEHGLGAGRPPKDEISPLHGEDILSAKQEAAKSAGLPYDTPKGPGGKTIETATNIAAPPPEPPSPTLAHRARQRPASAARRPPARTWRPGTRRGPVRGLPRAVRGWAGFGTSQICARSRPALQSRLDRRIRLCDHPPVERPGAVSEIPRPGRETPSPCQRHR
jgi:hypothetical protein